jgi:hypothetical protein
LRFSGWSGQRDGRHGFAVGGRLAKKPFFRPLVKYNFITLVKTKQF